MTEEGQIRAALFGDGSQAGALISNVLFGKQGANQYANMKTVLQKLTGISAGLDDKNHFHIYLRPPEILPIKETSNLSAGTAVGAQSDAVILGASQQTGAEGIFDYAQSVIDIGEEFMFIMDVTYVPVQDSAIVLTQDATLGSARGQVSELLLNACQEIPSLAPPPAAERLIDPIDDITGYYYQHFQIEPDLNSASATLLVGPKHGKISARADISQSMYQYDADPGYVGKDQVVFQVQYRGKSIRMVVDLQVSNVESIPDNGSGVCPAPQLIQVNGKPVSSSSGYDSNSISFNIAALPSGAVGQT
ncbi:MAG: hypothetical protein ABIT70_15905, partial [Sulfuriferula sp.]